MKNQYKKMCESCKVEFKFLDKDIIECKRIRSQSHLHSQTTKMVREGGWLMGYDMPYTTKINEFEEFEITYTAIKCPLCDYINPIKDLREEFVRSGFEEPYTYLGSHTYLG